MRVFIDERVNTSGSKNLKRFAEAALPDNDEVSLLTIGVLNDDFGEDGLEKPFFVFDRAFRRRPELTDMAGAPDQLVDVVRRQ